MGFTILILFLRLEKFKIIRHNNLFIKLLNAILNEIGLQFEANDELYISTPTHLKKVQSFGSYTLSLGEPDDIDGVTSAGITSLYKKYIMHAVTLVVIIKSRNAR